VYFFQRKILGSLDYILADMCSTYKTNRIVLRTRDGCRIDCLLVYSYMNVREDGCYDKVLLYPFWLKVYDGQLDDCVIEGATMIFCNPNAAYMELAKRRV
jgi:hypothetical protein